MGVWAYVLFGKCPKAKKCSCLGGGGVISQNAFQVAFISIMHCSLHVISLLTCCQREVLNACTCLYSQAAMHFGILPLVPYLANVPGLEHFLAKDSPSGHEHYLANVWRLEHFVAKKPPPPWAWALFGLPVPGIQSIFELPSCSK